MLTGVWADIEDDEQDRKTKMSGFYNEELETEITGMKPNRPSSPLGKKSVISLLFLESCYEAKLWRFWKSLSRYKE